MKLKTLSYSESRETVDAIGLKQWRKIGVEVELEEGETWETVYQSAKYTVQNWHNGSHNVTYTYTGETLPVIQSKDR